MVRTSQVAAVASALSGLFATLVVATQIYDLIPAGLGLGCAALVGIVAVAMHLDAHAVELPFDRSPIHALQGLVDRGRRLSEHRLNGSSDLQAEAVEAGRAGAHGRLGDGRHVAGEHGGSPDGRGLDAGGSSDGIRHDPGERTLS